MAFCDLQGPQQGAKIELSTVAGAIVIAGAGQAGGRAAEALRARGFQGKITMLGEEPHPPYERPQLSKDMLGAVDKPVSYIKQASDWTDVLDIQLETGSPVTHCDADRRTVATAVCCAFPAKPAHSIPAVEPPTAREVPATAI